MKEYMQIVHVQSVMLKKDVEKLKRLSGKTNIKDAVQKAVSFFLRAHEEEASHEDINV